ncbi:MAG: hypothetical protein ACKOOL_12810 [Novosphingobium sp.]
MFTRLQPPIPVHVEGKGNGQAIGMIDHGCEHALLWLTESEETGELWCTPSDQVRLNQGSSD